MKWRERIAYPPSAGSVKHQRLIELSMSFCTCAVGEQEGIVKHMGSSAPVDDRLFNLGLDFCQAISDANWFEAEQLLDKIETRAEEIRNEQLKQG